MVKVDVEYCKECGHIQKYMEMKLVIMKRVPESKVTGKSGRQNSFEVEVNKQLVFSKLKSRYFPDYDAIADVVEDAANGKPIMPVNRKLNDGVCSIL